MSPTTLTPRLFDLLDAGSVFDRPLAQPGEQSFTQTVECPQPRPDREADPAGGPTLDDVIVAAWEKLTTGSPAGCPVCHGDLAAVWSHGPRPVGGRCQACGTHLS